MIWLVGHKGAGKTTAAATLAKSWFLRWADTDHIVEDWTRRVCEDIISEDGDTMFRVWETLAIRYAADVGAAIVATGGGAVLRSENIDTMRRTGSIHLVGDGGDDPYRRERYLQFRKETT